MVPQIVNFTNFEIENPTRAVHQFSQNKPCFWPLYWTIILEPESLKHNHDWNMHAWFRNNCVHMHDVSLDAAGSRIFAFESDEEAALFLLSF